MRNQCLAMAMMTAAITATAAPAVTDKEQASFFEYYAAAHPSTGGLLRPQFAVTGERKKRRVTATVDGAAQRLVLPLCRQPRGVFDYDTKAKRWSERESQQLVWVHHGPQCAAQPETPVRLLAALPEMDILVLIQQHPTLLNNARLLMTGNTQCAPVRSRGFRLAGLDRAKNGLPVLVFENDIGGTARVAVRKLRNELVAWSAECAAAPR
ncbi:hypothetical protein [Massilia sp. YMA4]|uniref:hypothetical protein n=1 Tax=Massilia sp. YMA4 TaxID=1593482 RepID=UPI000DD1157A|nr:hypothetical protein [Massilia sp. YMA4]AXA92423.1 hypothetical protein DPH57_15475 [Massilia sp. YMA4]